MFINNLTAVTILYCGFLMISCKSELEDKENKPNSALHTLQFIYYSLIGIIIVLLCNLRSE